MAELSEKTRLEMEAGAKALATQSGSALPPGYMDAIVRTHERHAQLRRWETSGKIRVEHTKRYKSGGVRYKYNDDTLAETWHTMIHVLTERGGPTFTDIDAEQSGAFPSEVLIANIALYLQSVGEL
jgi:succinyl-CoA synthetase beta subunit